MSQTMSPPLALSGGRLELIPLDEGRWRLCDARVPHSDAAYVVAYIEQAEEVLDVVWLIGGGLPSTFVRFDEIIRLALRMITQGESHGSRRPVPIPSRAPRNR
jgi:hypothetical protein